VPKGLENPKNRRAFVSAHKLQQPATGVEDFPVGVWPRASTYGKDQHVIDASLVANSVTRRWAVVGCAFYGVPRQTSLLRTNVPDHTSRRRE
jgi:hypothetical protein